MAPNSPHVNLVEAGTVLTESETLSFENYGYESFIVYLNVAAVSGTEPSIDIIFQDSADGSTWFIVGSVTASAVESSRTVITGPLGKHMQALMSVGGTSPALTLSLDLIGCSN